ncbi:MAG TPA: HAD-IIIA family hydrolase [Verrucomicrobiota bacterium]|nr:HAD-IIIA family hydrolase [Verrucomicrobiota bacterium]
MRRAIFIERDGILNHYRIENNYPIPPTRPAELRIQTDAIPLIHSLKSSGFTLIVITNQPGISRGYMFWRDLDLIHKRLKEEFLLDDIFVCPHDENDGCNCRKPKLGLFIEAVYKWQIKLSESIIISDKWQDAQVARMLCCLSILINSPWIANCRHDLLVPNLASAVEKINQIKANNFFCNRIENSKHIRFVIGDA